MRVAIFPQDVRWNSRGFSASHFSSAAFAATQTFLLACWCLGIRSCWGWGARGGHVCWSEKTIAKSAIELERKDDVERASCFH